MRNLVATFALLALASRAPGDAIIRTQAMKASTIVEYFIEEDGVRVELEIGLTDLEAFRNLIPDGVYEKLGHPPRSHAERLAEFFARDLVLAPDGGEPILGRVVSMEPRKRIERDEITGEALPQAEDTEDVIFAVLSYPFEQRPAKLAFGAPRTAGIGFVAYHRRLPVNDFRYLGPYTLVLDWDDPWYSRFEHKGLRRAYFAPMSGFLYVEPYEVRKEIIVRPKDLQGWIDLGLTGRTTIPPGMQPELMRKAAEFLRGKQKVLIDGRAVEPELARINFLRRTLRASSVVDPPEELDLISATLGVIFVYPTDGLPQRATMEWDLFNERIQVVPCATVDQAGPLPFPVDPDAPVLEYTNFLKQPRIPRLLATEAPPGALASAAGWGRWVLAALAVLLALRRRWVVATVAAAAAAGAFLFTTQAEPDRRGVVETLLRNVYHAFDFREEGRIYDVLAQSVDGDLLTKIYLETRRGLELRNLGGARTKVKSVTLVELDTEADGPGFLARATWDAAGSVGHWGHVHQRTNRYRAELTIDRVDGVWKLTGVEIFGEERL